jgi:hypothetical protein
MLKCLASELLLQKYPFLSYYLTIKIVANYLISTSENHSKIFQIHHLINLSENG